MSLAIKNIADSETRGPQKKAKAPFLPLKKGGNIYKISLKDRIINRLFELKWIIFFIVVIILTIVLAREYDATLFELLGYIIIIIGIFIGLISSETITQYFKQMGEYNKIKDRHVMEEVRRGTPLGRIIKELVDNGEKIPREVYDAVEFYRLHYDVNCIDIEAQGETSQGETSQKKDEQVSQNKIEFSIGNIKISGPRSAVIGLLFILIGITMLKWGDVTHLIEVINVPTIAPPTTTPAPSDAANALSHIRSFLF